MTVYEKIMKMSINELAYEFYDGFCRYIRENTEHCDKQDSCDKCIENWLKSEAKEI